MSTVLVFFAFCVVTVTISASIFDFDDETTTVKIVGCKERNRLIGIEKNDKFDLIEVELRSVIQLKCHYCDENDDNAPKIWYKIDPYNTSSHEVELGMEASESENRILVRSDHTLIIKNVDVDDAGTYYCQQIDFEHSEFKYNYVLDVVVNETMPTEIGSMQDWKNYVRDYLEPVSRRIQESNDTECAFLKQIAGVKLSVVSEWQREWSPCEVCGRPQGEGLQKMYGFCRIKIEDRGSRKDVPGNISQKIKYFISNDRMSCRSTIFNQLFPLISNLTKRLPNFMITRKCDGVCNPDAEGINRGWKFSNSKKYKYRKSYTLKEGSHLTLVCPESTLDNVIVWRRNGKILKRGEAVGKEGRIVVDTFNTLYLMDVSLKEEGNYSCQVDSIRMQQATVYVYSKSKLLSSELVRHLFYLGVILGLTSSCYCAGLVIACRKKRHYKTYEQLLQDTFGSRVH